jgi:phosphopantetheinyl transferase
MTSSEKPDLRWAVEAGVWRTHKEQSEAARRLLCRLVGDSVTIDHDSQGAPYVPKQPELHISISHCRTAVAAAVSNKYSVGIDIESRRKVSLSLMERVCTGEELAAIHSSSDPTMTFLQFWTRKEAVLKMRGTGIRGFGSMVEALSVKDCKIEEIYCGLADTVAALATAL